MGNPPKALEELAGKSVKIAFSNQGYTGDTAEQAAAAQGIALMVSKHTEAKHGLVLLQRRWVFNQSIGWAALFRRVARDCERMTKTLAGFHHPIPPLRASCPASSSTFTKVHNRL